jgi:lipoate-protein ligase A
LQHGTLPLSGDLTRITQVLAFSDEAARESAAVRLQSRATTAEQVLGSTLSWETAAEAFIVSFQDVLNLELIPSDLLPQELKRAEQLVREKFNHPSWTEKAN